MKPTQNCGVEFIFFFFWLNRLGVSRKAPSQNIGKKFEYIRIWLQTRKNRFLKMDTFSENYLSSKASTDFQTQGIVGQVIDGASK